MSNQVVSQSVTHPDDSAYPLISTEPHKQHNNQNRSYEDVSSSGGLTKREYFAAYAMQALIQRNDIYNDGDRNATNSRALESSNGMSWLTAVAVEMADNLIEMLNNEDMK